MHVVVRLFPSGMGYRVWQADPRETVTGGSPGVKGDVVEPLAMDLSIALVYKTVLRVIKLVKQIADGDEHEPNSESGGSLQS